jgi:hypothetical protein
VSRVFSIGGEDEWAAERILIPDYLTDAFGPECMAAPYVPPPEDDPIYVEHPELVDLWGRGDAFLGSVDPVPWLPNPVPPDDRCVAVGVTLAAWTAGGLILTWAQPLVDTTARAYGTWYGVRDLVLAAREAQQEDPAAGTLWAVAAAMKRVTGEGGRLSHLTELLVQYHPSRDAPRRQRCRDWWDQRAREGWGT